jgi:trehalose 6-phosphate synthase
MLALLSPSRADIPEYADEIRRIEAAAARVEESFPGALALEIADDFPRSVAAYKQFDVLLVNAVMDGLNLVCKEAPFVNERAGAVVLSVHAGAFEEIGDWVVPVEPLDVDATADALEDALALPEPERRRRQEAIRARVREHDLAEWDEAQLADLDRAVSMRQG